MCHDPWKTDGSLWWVIAMFKDLWMERFGVSPICYGKISALSECLFNRSRAVEATNKSVDPGGSCRAIQIPMI